MPTGTVAPTTQMPTGPIECGKVPLTGSRIIGGKKATKGKWPWIARIVSLYPGPMHNQGFCGGTLVDYGGNYQWIVTASHCIIDEQTGKAVNKSSIKIRLGDHDDWVKENSEQEFAVEKIIPHENYNVPEQSTTNDIALIKLSTAAKMTNYVRPICLPVNVPAPAEGTTCSIAGWGSTLQWSSPQFLQEANVPIVGLVRCKNAYPNKIDASMLCAGYKEGKIDACQGDSGGPLMCAAGGRFYLQGATSWGEGCAQPEKYGVYAHVKGLLSWIQQKMANN